MATRRIVLAYSGGLDTSVALHWMQANYGAEVIAFCADVGQRESLEDVRERALATGAAAVHVVPLRDRFLREFALPALQAHATYEGRYLLAAPLSRPLIASRMVELAHEVGAGAVAHGATGKGNDMVRFRTCVTALDASLQVLCPAIDWELKNRQDEFDYALRHGIPGRFDARSLYSVDTNAWGGSIECGPINDISLPAPADAWRLTAGPERWPDSPERVRIGFERGVPTTLQGLPVELTELVESLNVLAGRHGIGRTDIVESRVVGLKTRGLYEAPAATLLLAAHRELESLVLDRETLHYKELTGQRYGELVYYGYWFSDLRRALDAFTATLQEEMTGSIALDLFKGGWTVAGRSAPGSRHEHGVATYEAEDSFDHRASAGFAQVWALPLARTPRPSAAAAVPAGEVR